MSVRWIDFHELGACDPIVVDSKFGGVRASRFWTGPSWWSSGDYGNCWFLPKLRALVGWDFLYLMIDHSRTTIFSFLSKRVSKYLRSTAILVDRNSGRVHVTQLQGDQRGRSEHHDLGQPKWTCPVAFPFDSSHVESSKSTLAFLWGRDTHGTVWGVAATRAIIDVSC